MQLLEFRRPLLFVDEDGNDEEGFGRFDLVSKEVSIFLFMCPSVYFLDRTGLGFHFICVYMRSQDFRSPVNLYASILLNFCESFCESHACDDCVSTKEKIDDCV